MGDNNDPEVNGAWSSVVIVTAMLIGALAAEALEGIPQIAVVSACLTIMFGGVISNVMRRLRG